MNAVKSIVGRASKEADSSSKVKDQETSGYSKTAKAAAFVAVAGALVAGTYYSGAGSYIASFFKAPEFVLHPMQQFAKEFYEKNLATSPLPAGFFPANNA